MADIATGMLDVFTGDAVKELLDLRPWMQGKTFELIIKPAEVEVFIDKLIEKGICGLDLETTSLNTRCRPDGTPYAEIVGVCLAITPNHGVYIPVRHEDKEFNVPLKFMLHQIKRLVNNCVCVYHNFKYDGEVLRDHGIIIEDEDMYEDTYLMTAIHDASRKEKGLKFLSEHLLKRPMIELSELGITGAKKNIVAFSMVPPQTAVYYGASDAMNTLGLYLLFKNEIDKQDPDGRQGPWYIYKIEKRCLFVTMEMERNPVLIDKKYLSEIRVEVQDRMNSLLKKIHAIAGREFDINSPKQLGTVLFDELKVRYPIPEKSASGQYKTDEKTLTLIEQEAPIVKNILSYRGYTKLIGTYIDNFLNNLDEEGMAKFQLNQVRADTGRFSASGGKGIKEDGYCGINCQNIPTYNPSDPDSIDMRKAVIARPGFKIATIDYSGEELRIAANMSREPKWIHEFNHGSADLHTITGKIIHGKEEISKIERGLGKCVSKGTRIATQRGWVAIENLTEKDLVITHKRVLKPIERIHDMGTKKAVTIVTTSGHSIKCGYNHKFLTLEGEWVRAEDLEIGQEICSSSCELISPKKSPEIPFNEKRGFTSRGNKIFSISRWVFESRKEVSKGFLQELFEAHGTVYKSGVVSVCTSDLESAKDLLLLLTQFNIMADIYEKPSKECGVNYYQVKFGRVGAEEFYKNIGFINKIKKEKLKEIISKPKRSLPLKGQKWVTKVQSKEFHEKVDLMDLTIKDDHTYIAEGLVTHNTLNFHTIYGGGAGGFAVRAKLQIDTAKKMLLNFFKKYDVLSKWLHDEAKRAKKRGYSKTAFGRRRPLGEFYSSNDRKIMAQGDRCAINSAIQGSGADILKIALYRVWKWIHSNGFGEDDIRILIPIHDEIVYEIREDKLGYFIENIAEIMCLHDFTERLQWPVKLAVDAEYGNSLSITNDYFKEKKEMEKQARSEGLELPDIKNIDIKKEEVLVVEDPKSVENIKQDSEAASPPLKKEEADIKEEKSQEEPEKGATNTQLEQKQSVVPLYEAKQNTTVSKNGDSQYINFTITFADAKEKQADQSKEVVDNVALSDDRLKNRLDDMGFYVHEVKAIDPMASIHLKTILDMLEEYDAHLVGPKCRIKLVAPDGVVLHKVYNKVSVDAFEALCLWHNI